MGIWGGYGGDEDMGGMGGGDMGGGQWGRVDMGVGIYGASRIHGADVWGRCMGWIYGADV